MLFLFSRMALQIIQKNDTSVTHLASEVEKDFRGRIYLHLEKHGLTSESQHSFVQKRYCFTNMNEFFFKKVTKMIDMGVGLWMLSPWSSVKHLTRSLMNLANLAWYMTRLLVEIILAGGL